MNLDPNRPAWQQFKALHASAERILKHFEILDPPVDVDWLAERLGTQVFYAPDLGCSGAVDPRTSPARIWVNASEAPVRQRFTLAHELGHLLLHPADVAFRDTTFVGGALEAQANGYAANIIIPLWMLRAVAPIYHYDIEALADLFKVSARPMEIRLNRLLGVPIEG